MKFILHPSSLILLWSPPLLWMILIFLGSSLSGGAADDVARRSTGIREPVEIQRLKDMAHITEYGILSALLARAVTGRTYRLSRNQALICIAIAAIYGVTDELHQYYVPNRYPSMDDVIRNTVGAVSGVAAVLLLTRLRRRAAIR